VRFGRLGSEPLIRIEVPTETRSGQCSVVLKSQALCDTWMSLAAAFSEDPQLRKGNDATEASNVTD